MLNGLLCRLGLCLSALGALFISSAYAQYHFDVWTSDNGLLQNSVYSIAQTPNGYIWFTTLAKLPA